MKLNSMNLVEISYKKSPVKQGNQKALFFEVKSPWDKDTIFFFTDRSRLKAMQEDPTVVLETLHTIPGMTEMLEQARTTSTDIRVTYKGMIKSKTSLIENKSNI